MLFPSGIIDDNSILNILNDWLSSCQGLPVLCFGRRRRAKQLHFVTQKLEEFVFPLLDQVRGTQDQCCWIPDRR